MLSYSNYGCLRRLNSVVADGGCTGPGGVGGSTADQITQPRFVTVFNCFIKSA